MFHIFGLGCMYMECYAKKRKGGGKDSFWRILLLSFTNNVQRKMSKLFLKELLKKKYCILCKLVTVFIFSDIKY